MRFGPFGFGHLRYSINPRQMPPVRWLLLLSSFIPVMSLKPALIDVKSACDDHWMNVTLMFSGDFHGLVWSKGSDCAQARGTGPSVSIAINPRQCGIRISKDVDGLVYTASLQVQMSSAVQQAVDPVVQVKCHLHQDMLSFKSKSSRRSGRKLKDGGRAWLEVRGSAISSFNSANILTVGEHTVLSVHTKLPDGIFGMPVDCRVEDGHGSIQSLTDARGCPTEPSLVPALHPAKSPGTWVTAFPAFSFPDSSLVHYICLLMLCSGECPQYECTDEENGVRNSRNFQDDSEENILDYVELYNNVEVTAPNIELGYLKKDMSDILSVEDNSGWVCLSGPRVAMVFALLGALFLAAVLATLLLLIRHRRRYHHTRLHYGL